MTDRVKYANPFSMGNLSDLGFARENDDLEYLKEWSRKAVKAYEADAHIRHKAFERLIEISDTSSTAVKEIHEMLKEQYRLSTGTTNLEEET